MGSLKRSARRSSPTGLAGRVWRRAATSRCCCLATSKGRLDSERAIAWRASGIPTPTRAELARLDGKRPKKGSNDDWTHPQEPDAKITREGQAG